MSASVSQQWPDRGLFSPSDLQIGTDHCIILAGRGLPAAQQDLNLLAKQFPEFSEKHEIAGDVRFRVEALQAVAEMTPEQLKALADGARA